MYYGLQEEHGFSYSFDGYLETIGLKEKLLSNDTLDVYNAIGTLTLTYIADSHSAPLAASPYLGEKIPVLGIDYEIAHFLNMTLALGRDLSNMRKQIMGEVDFYQKVGNTAYITFDSFSLGYRADYSEETLQISDTISIIMYAHEQITNDPEIENVVVDLSCNGGGAVDACVYLVAWMLGYCDLSVYNSITESSATTTYKIDVNMDGVFDSKDSIADKNLYCMTSPVSFSCGNYAPAILKSSGRVNIVGKTSGGGACMVLNATLADGTIFCVSSSSQMSYVVNGSYYHADTGVEPDVVLTKYESFYDRVALTEYLNSLK
jgi:C-terminal processing protease CtpA/Prc